MFKANSKIVWIVLFALLLIGLGLAAAYIASVFYYRQGLKAIASGEVPIAIADFQKSVTWNPYSASAWEKLGDTLRLSMFDYRGFDLRPDLSLQEYQSTAGAAIAAYDRAIALGIQSPNAYYARGVLRYFVKGDASGARSDFEMSLKFAPNLAIAHYMLGYLAMAVDHDRQSATTLMQQTIDSLPSDFPASGRAVMLNGLGWAYDATGQYDEALAVLQQAVTADPNNCMAWNNIADVENSEGQYDHALLHARWSIALNSPTCILAYVTLGQIFENLHNAVAAQASYEKFLNFGDYINTDPSGQGYKAFVIGRLSALKTQ